MSERDAKIRGALIGPAKAGVVRSRESISHLDGCHFYCWLMRDGESYSVTFDEREGDDLFLHGCFGGDEDREACQRCWALRRGAASRHLRVALPDYPRDADAHEGFLHTLGVVGFIDEATDRVDRVTLADLESHER